MREDIDDLIRAYAYQLIESGEGFECAGCKNDITESALRNGYQIDGINRIEFNCVICDHPIRMRLVGSKWLYDVIKFDSEYIPQSRRKSSQRSSLRSLSIRYPR